MMEKSTYFHSSLHRFAPSAREQIIHRLLLRYPSVDCGYDAQDESFYLVCPKETGPDADDCLRKIIYECISTAPMEDTPHLQRFEESRVHALFQTATANTAQATEVATAPQQTIKTYMMHSENARISVGALRLRDLPLQVRRRQLIYVNTNAWSVLRAVSNHLEYNARQGEPIYEQEDQALLLLAPFKPLNLFVKSKSLSNNEFQTSIQELESGNGEVKVNKWLQGQDDTGDGDPNRQSPRVIDKDTLKMLSAPTIAPVPGRMRVPHGASIATLPGDDAESESNSSTDSDTSSSLTSKRSFGQLYKAKGDVQTPHERQSLPTARVAQTVLATGSPEAKGGTARAVQRVGRLHAVKDTRGSPSATTPDEDISTLNSATRQDIFPDYGKQYATVDTMGLSGNAANQAKWELESTSAGNSIPTASTAAGPGTSDFDSDEHLKRPAWASRVVPNVLEGHLVDTSFPENAIPVRNPRIFPPLQAQSNRMPLKNKTRPQERLIDIDDDDCPPIVDKLATNASNWPPTHNVMRQKAQKKSGKKVGTGTSSKVELPLPSPPPRPKPKQEKQATTKPAAGSQETSRAGSNPQLTVRDSTLRDIIYQALQSAERFPTKVSIRFGTCMVLSQEVPSEMWTENQLYKHLQSNVTQSQFSRRLTTSTKDAEHMLNLENDANPNVEVMYEFHLVTAERQLKILRINQESPEQCTMVELGTPIAEVHCFNLLRMFDTQLVLEEDETALPVTSAMRDFVNTVTTDVRACQLHASSPPSGLAVTKIVAKRIFEKAGLKVTQYQNLVLERSGTSTEGNRMDESDMIADGRLWWEADFEETNLSDPEMVMEACIRLRARADEMVKCMDGVGFHNEGPLKDTPEVKEDVQEVYVPFW